MLDNNMELIPQNPTQNRLQRPLNSSEHVFLLYNMNKITISMKKMTILCHLCATMCVTSVSLLCHHLTC